MSNTEPTYTRTATGAEVLRVRDRETGHHITIARAVFEDDPKRYAVLRSPALDSYGAPQGPKFRTDKGDTAAADAAADVDADGGVYHDGEAVTEHQEA